MEEKDKDMDKMRQEINNLGEQVSKILELLSMGKGKAVVDTAQSSNPIQDTDDPIYPPGFTPYHINVPQSQTTQHYVPTNPLYVVPPIIPGIEHLEAQAKIQDMEQNENTPAKQKLDVLEERLRAIEETDVYGNIDATQLCLVPGLIIPAKFKVPEFDKYDGSTCPRSHLIMYCRKMATHINNDKLLVHCFQDSLTDPASRWYIQLDNAHIHVWKDLADAFLKQYKHNIDMAPDRLDLQRVEKKSSESFKEYAQRWRDMVAEVQPPLTDKEMTSMFMNTLRAPFYERMIGNASTNFSDIIVIGERIEYGIKHGRLAEATTEYGGIKKGTISKKKEGEVHAIGFPNSGKHKSIFGQRKYEQNFPSYISNVSHIPYNSYVPAHTVSETPKPVNSNSPRPFVQGQGSKTNSDTWRFDPIPMTYTELLPQLIQNRQLASIPMIPIQPPYPKWYDSNARCDYHAGGVGHSTENCLALKRNVQSLINAGWLSFKKSGEKSNVYENPLPDHENPKVNVVDSLVEKCENEVHEIVMPMEALFEGLFEAGYVSHEYLDPNIRYEGYDESRHCIFHRGVAGHVVQQCQKFRSKVQQLMDSKILTVYRGQGKDEMKYSKICVLMDEVSEKKDSFLPRPLTVFYQESRNESTSFCNPKKLTIQVPSPFKFKDLKAVPWRYDCQVITGPLVDNITEISGITRSGRCYKPDNLTVPSNGLILEQGRKNEKRNAKEHCKDQDVEMPIVAKDIEYKKLVTDEEANEFLKIVKQKSHRKVLLDILNKAHVGHDISVEKFSGIIGNITSSNSIVFTDDEIPPEGLGHTKALHIQLKCKDYVIARVLVDNGSALNIMPKSTLLMLPVDMSHIKSSTMVVKAFDGSRREVMGDIELPVKIGPCIFNIVFQVMEITPTYSFLLGRPWIHSAGVVPSTLHQKLKFIVGSKLICVMGEEDFLITKPVSTPYVEATEEALECSFCSFEIAHATMMEATVDEVIKPHKSKVEVMTTRIMGGGGYSLNKNLETLLKIPSNDGRFGLGYKPSIYDKIRLQKEKKKKRLAKLEMREFDPSIKLIPELYDTFKSAGISYSSDNSDLKDDLLTKMESLSVAAVAQEASFEGNTVYACPAFFELNNWDSVDLPTFSRDFQDSTLDALIYTMESDKENDDEDDVGISSELLRMVEEEDEVLGPHQELVEAINLGSQEESKEDMSGLSTDIVVHRVPLKPECNPVRQKLRKMKPDVLIKIKEEVQKQIEAGFLTVSKYPEWVANIVPVPKKDGKVRMCMDYRDLNRASPKDNFPLPHIDMLVDNTAGYSTFSFMDGFSGYNQIKMAEEDREKTTFITLWGTFCYKVMPFGLKNVGATYQRAMVTLFHDMMHKEIEVYVDDMIAKSKTDEDHTTTL
ncbi:uncharacterized protein E6C27_scaffold86G00180 [Cucumis melo var. makuwa]|uniref:Reverse transcriptase domain-containing protein n=1 Tax=Cucumis melo var. makuwa TaxID=1194695 RepID=A0A5A7T0H8_CUCMM|nr:uncharacterized protein E6C27_scaffold86G00180 [Cucumis melo var. makuwa]